jgi:SAM-dependent methyltransferase
VSDAPSRLDYDRPGVASAYARGRRLPDDTIARWGAVVAGLAPPDGVRRALDLGCGIGRFSGMLAAALGAGVVGVEPSLRMLAERDPGSPARFVAGAAEAVPLRAGCVDLAFLSMVYHHLRSVPAAVAELARVLRRGGHVVLRTTTLETLDGFAFLDFFPEAKALDVARMPGRDAVAAAFAAGGFAPVARRTVPHRIAADHDEYLRKVTTRAFSALTLVADEVFARRLPEFERYCRAAAPGAPVWEPVDVFAFRLGP